MKVYKLLAETKIKLVLSGDVQDIKDIRRKIREHYKIDFGCNITISYDSVTNTSIVNLSAKNIEPCEIDL